MKQLDNSLNMTPSRTATGWRQDPTLILLGWPARVEGWGWSLEVAYLCKHDR